MHAKVRVGIYHKKGCRRQELSVITPLQHNQQKSKMDFPYESQVKTQIPPLEQETFDGVAFTYMRWPSSLKDSAGTQTITKCRVLIVHGFCEYYKVYYKLMDNLSLNGIESFMFDQRGAGDTSPGKQKGDTNELFTFSDLDHFIEMNLKECEPLGRKLFLFGHSMGGGIVLNYGCSGRYRDKIAGIITTGPLIELHPISRPNFVLRALAPVLATILPSFKIDTKLHADAITSDEQYKQTLKTDPKLSLIGSFRQIHDMLTRGKRLLTDKEYTAQFQLPVLVMHGDADLVNDPEASEKFVNEKIPLAKDRTLKRYKDAKHSLLSIELDEHFHKAFNDTLSWINDRV